MSVQFVIYHPNQHEWRGYDKQARLQCTAGEIHLDRILEEFPQAIAYSKDMMYTRRYQPNPPAKRNLKGINMKIATTKEQFPTRRGREATPNPFEDKTTLDKLCSGDTFRINVEDGEKANTILNKLRDAAKTRDMRVRVAQVEDGDFKDAKSFLVKLEPIGDKKR